MNSRREECQPLGHVAFVGVGPGDEGLLTVRAVDRLRTAQVVIADHAGRQPLISRLCPVDVEVIDGSFGEDGQSMTRASRAKLVVRAAESKARVVRLLDGEPSTFVGLTDEIVACRKRGISVDIVPGVSKVSAVPAYAGVTLNPPGTTGIHVLAADADVAWERHVDPMTSVVIVGRLEAVQIAVSKLKLAGRDPLTPIAVTLAGTTPRQRTVEGRLKDIERTLKAARLIPEPDDSAVAMIGQGVSARASSSWFETQPLFGWRILVPRTKEQAGSMVSALAEFGATATVVPTIGVEPPRTPAQVEKAVKGLVTGRYEWIGFTSVNAVRAIREKFTEFGLDARAFAGVRVAAVGGVTAEAVRAWGIEPDLVPTGDQEQSAKGLLEAWPPFDEESDPINRVLLPRADIATDTLVAGLQTIGWEVDDVTAYRTVRAAPPPAEIRDAIKGGRFDAVLFTSSSTVRNLIGIAGKPHAATVVACIGPATAKTAEEHGLRVDVLAHEPSAAALVNALAEFGEGLRLAAGGACGAAVRPSQRRQRRAAK
jgi:uroporphyrinogen III methyltransferase/synthase